MPPVPIWGARDEKEILDLKVSIVLEEAAMHPSCAHCSPQAEDIQACQWKM